MEKVIIKGKTVPISETKVKFGFGSLVKPTPESAKIVFRTVLYAATVLTIVLNTFSEIPEDFKNAANNYALEVVALVHALTKLFGLEEK